MASLENKMRKLQNFLLMSPGRNRLYPLLFTACVAGYVWVAIGRFNSFHLGKPIEVCLMKRLFHIPCPSCGSTRSILSLLKGNFIEALNFNPLGYLVAGSLLILPVWILVDVVGNTDTLYCAYRNFETFIQKKLIVLPLVILLMVNWVWNIWKGL